MYKYVIILMVLVSITSSGCSDVMDETLINKDLEQGQFNTSRFNEASWGK